MSRFSRPRAGVLLLPLLLAGCSGSSPTAPGGITSAASVEAASFQRINDARRDAGRPELAFDPVLSEIARRHSQRMRDAGFFDHEDPSGGGLASRLAAAGVGYRAAGENLAMVTRSGDPAATAHDLLMHNPEHRANILHPAFTDAGVGVVQAGDTYWITQVFLAR